MVIAYIINSTEALRIEHTRLTLERVKETSHKLHTNFTRYRVVYQTLHTRTMKLPQTSLQTAKTSLQTLKTSLQTPDKRYKSERH